MNDVILYSYLQVCNSYYSFMQEVNFAEGYPPHILCGHLGFLSGIMTAHNGYDDFPIIRHLEHIKRVANCIATTIQDISSSKGDFIMGITVNSISEQSLNILSKFLFADKQREIPTWWDKKDLKFLKELSVEMDDAIKEEDVQLIKEFNVGKRNFIK